MAVSKHNALSIRRPEPGMPHVDCLQQLYHARSAIRSQRVYSNPLFSMPSPSRLWAPLKSRLPDTAGSKYYCNLAIIFSRRSYELLREHNTPTPLLGCSAGFRRVPYRFGKLYPHTSSPLQNSRLSTNTKVLKMSLPYTSKVLVTKG